MNRFDARIAIVVPSCDAYADVWPPLFQALARHWPDNPFPKYLITNRLAPRFDGVATLAVGEDVSWSDNLLRALDHVSAPYVLLNIDDLILCKRVDDAAVLSLLSRFVESAGSYLRLNPTPPGASMPGDFDLIRPGDLYRSSTIFSVWRKDVLRAVLRPGESAWHFEIDGSSRTDAFGDWFAAKRPLLGYVNLVVKGKVDPGALAVLESQGTVYRSDRPVLAGTELARLWLRRRRSDALALLPPRIGRTIRGVFRAV